MGRIAATRRLLAIAAFVAGVAGLMLNETLRDAKPASALVFYALPLPISGLSLLIAALLFRARFWRMMVALAGIATLSIWLFQSYGMAYPAKAKWKVIEWNMGRPRHPFEPLLSLVRMERPDVVVLIESGDISPAMTAYYQTALPGYRVVPKSKELTCIVRGKMLGSNVRGLVNGSDVARFHVEVDGERMNVFAADLGASPFMPRRPQIDMLAAFARVGPRTIVMGDFNTPLESAQLDQMRESFTEARSGPHHGFRETWPYNLPLLSLDQIWLSRDLEPVFSTRRLGFASDHAPVIVSFNPVK
ncbi:MAG: endonuclease/exonuclease/phosphatase family protein [Chthoniobacterales bacterium]